MTGGRPISVQPPICGSLTPQSVAPCSTCRAARLRRWSDVGASRGDRRSFGEPGECRASVRSLLRRERGRRGRSRNVKSAYFEVDAPFASLAKNGFGAELNVSGRYDKYSTGQKNFSPKVGFKVTPIREIAFRGTWSRGFRIPSFNESFGLPTTGYTTLQITPAQCLTAVYSAFCAAHSSTSSASNPNGYALGQYGLGRTSIGNPNLSPEKSTSYTLGTILEPVRGISFTIDYFKIRVNNVIANISGQEQTDALNAYFQTGNTTAVPGVPRSRAFRTSSSRLHGHCRALSNTRSRMRIRSGCRVSTSA